MSWHSIIYGLHVCANLPIPGAREIPKVPPEKIDLRVTWGKFPQWLKDLHQPEVAVYYVSPWCKETGKPHLKVYKLAEGRYFKFQYQEGVEFICDLQEKQIWGNWQQELTLDYAALFFLGPIMGFWLRQMGTTCLHASCLKVGESALALVGVSGAGKSTTVAALAARGYEVLSDDVLPLTQVNGEFYAIPGYPRLRLWPSSVEVLWGDTEAKPRLAPNYEKRYFALNQDSFHLNPLPLRVIYFLDWSSEGDRPALVQCPPLEGFTTLVVNTYRNELLDKEMRQQEFFCLSLLANQVALRRVVAYRNLTKLSLLCDLILQDFQATTEKLKLNES